MAAGHNLAAIRQYTWPQFLGFLQAARDQQRTQAAVTRLAVWGDKDDFAEFLRDD